MRIFRITTACLLLAALAPVVAHAAGVMELLRYLPPRETVTEADAVKAAAVLLGERAGAMDTARCEARLREKNVLGASDSYNPTRPLKKGFACMLFARGMGLKGGWAGRLSGGRLGPRLAYKELQFLDMIPPLGEGDSMTGGELVALLKHAQDHIKEEGLEHAARHEYRKKKKERYGHGR